jgi:hypothetical protein
MQKWAYMVLKGSGDHINSANGENLNTDIGKRQFHVYLKTLGQEGWEMVGITYKDNYNFYIFLKRPLEN